MTAQIKAIILDFGNVVGFFDYGPALARLRTLSQLAEEEIRLAIDASELPDAFESGQITAEHFLDRIVEICQMRPDCDRRLLAAAWSDIFTPNREVCDLVPRLASRFRLILGSNTNELHSRQFRSQFADVLRHFSELVLSHEIRAMKPDARFYLHCVRAAHCDAAECLFIDDLAINVEGARACGLQGIVYRPGGPTITELRDLGIP